jgi:hypothetical protein
VWFVVIGVVFCVGFELVFCSLFCLFGFLTMFDLVTLTMSGPHAHTFITGRAIGLDAGGKLLLWWGCCGVCVGGRRGFCGIVWCGLLWWGLCFVLVLNWCFAFLAF